MSGIEKLWPMDARGPTVLPLIVQDAVFKAADDHNGFAAGAAVLISSTLRVERSAEGGGLKVCWAARAMSGTKPS